MISFSINDSDEFDAGPERASDEDREQLDAMVDPAARGSFPGGVSEVLAATDRHAFRGDHPATPAVPGCRRCDPGDCDCPRPPAPGSVSAWLADLAARPVDSGTRLAVAVIDPGDLTATAVRDYLLVTDKLLAADHATHHGGVLAVADSARADLDHGIGHRPDGTGGPTAAWSMGPLCRFHHRARTLQLWRPTAHRIDGSITWTDPTGRTWHQSAHDLRPDPAEP